MGQMIDLNTLTNQSADNVSGETENESAMNYLSPKEVEEERVQRRSELRKKLQSMSTKALLQTVLEAQETRVATYRKYDRGLDQILETQNMSHYPHICSEATASFSVLSDTIKALHNMLMEREEIESASQVGQLQKAEMEKLNLTAALHLERIREQAHGWEEERDGNCSSIGKLLRESVQSLQSKISTCVETINESIDEIRATMIEIED
jgi:hypothetical protein